MHYNYRLIALLLVASGTLSAQMTRQLEPIDSIVFEGRQGYFFKSGDGFCAFDAEKGTIIHYSLDGKVQKSIALDATYLLKNKRRFHPGLVFQTENQILLFNQLRYRFDVFDNDGRYLHSRKIDIKFKGDKYFINQLYPPYYPVTDGQTVYLAIHKSNWKGYSRSQAAFIKGGLRHYNEPGLVGEFDLDGHLLNVFGRYDSIYRQGRLLSYLDGYSFGQIGRDSIFISFQLGNQVSIYHKGAEKTPIASIGDCFNRDLYNLFAVNNRAEYVLADAKHLIETPHYFDCVVLGGKYLVRSYTTAIEDTVQFSPEEIDTRQRWARGDLKGCRIITKHDNDQAKEYASKPCYVQIYLLSHPTTPVYDGPIPIRFPMCLGLKGEDTFVFTSYLRAEAGKPDNHVVYHLRLKKR